MSCGGCAPSGSEGCGGGAGIDPSQMIRTDENVLNRDNQLIQDWQNTLTQQQAQPIQAS